MVSPLCFVYLSNNTLHFLFLVGGSRSWPQRLWDTGRETLAGLGASWRGSTPLRARGPAAAGSEAHSPSSLLSLASPLLSPAGPLGPSFLLPNQH